ncbi:MAG TPA: Ig-like domain-containing protein [Candidatus Dormibacteraeota bacterium]
MSQHMDPELNDVLQDAELQRIAHLLSAAGTPEPPLDDAFKSALRRQLMDIAWGGSGGRVSWWRQLLTPARMSWAGAAAAVVVIASVVIYTANQPTGGITEIVVGSPQQDQSAVALHQPILVSFNQPMDHPSTEKAVQITPATTVTFSWHGDAELSIQPVSGDLAPNTQYQVTIGPGALTKAQQPISQPQTITFVTQPTTPAPSPSPSPRPNTSLLTGVQQLASIGNGTVYAPQWSADSSTVYFVNGAGALESVAAKGGSTATLVPDGVSLPAISPAGDRLAYVRNGKIEILTLASSSTAEIPAGATTLEWVKDKLYWGNNSGVFTLGDDGNPLQLAPTPTPDGGVLSIAPGAGHAIVGQGNSLLILDIASGNTTPLCSGGCATTFQGWSPNGQRVVYNSIVADMNGKTINTLPVSGDVAWSAQNRVLVGSDTVAYSLRPDGSSLTKLADGTFRLPAWAPDSNTFVFLRGNALWVATAPAAPAPTGAITQATAVVTAFMNARLQNEPDKARTFLDDQGKVAYSSGNPQLIPSSDLQFKRFYVLMAEADPSSANTVRVVVRMVFGKNKQERSSTEETLIVTRAQGTDPFLIDAVTQGAQRDLGKGPEVVSVKVSDTRVDVTFDSDLVPSTIGGVVLQDSTGAAIQVTPAYDDRTVTFDGLQLTPGAKYTLIVMPSVQDVGEHHAGAEYDLSFVGPAAAPTAGGVTPPAVPSPSPVASPTPSPSA